MWSYDPELGTTADKVRFHIQDTDANDQLVSDEEVAFALESYGSNEFRTAAGLCRSIALKLGRRPSVVLAGIGLSSKEQHDHYMELAREFDAKAALKGGGVFAGGISKSDKDTREEDTDRVTPAFTSELHTAP